MPASKTEVLTPEQTEELKTSTTIVLAYDRAPLVRLNDEWKTALDEWRAFEIESLDDEDLVSEAVGTCQSKLKELDEERKKLALPMDRELKAFNTFYKEISAPLVEFKEEMSKKLSEVRAKRDAAAAEADRLVAEAAERGDEDATFDALASRPEPVKVAGTRTVYQWQFEIVNEGLIQGWAKTFDEKKAKAFCESQRLQGLSPSIAGVVVRYVPKVSTTGRTK